MKPQLEELEGRCVPSVADPVVFPASLPAPLQGVIPQMQALLQADLNQLSALVPTQPPQTQAAWNAFLTTWQQTINNLPALATALYRQEVFALDVSLLAQAAHQFAAASLARNGTLLFNNGFGFFPFFGGLYGLPFGFFPYSNYGYLGGGGTTGTFSTSGSTGGGFGGTSGGMGLYADTGSLDTGM